jgi:hypothetical protein
MLTILKYIFRRRNQRNDDEDDGTPNLGPLALVVQCIVLLSTSFAAIAGVATTICLITSFQRWVFPQGAEGGNLSLCLFLGAWVTIDKTDGPFLTSQGLNADYATENSSSTTFNQKYPPEAYVNSNCGRYRSCNLSWLPFKSSPACSYSWWRPTHRQC